MAEIVWTREAESWLREVYHYIASDNPQAAKMVVNKIYNKVQLLTDNPEIGHKYRDTDRGQ